MLTTTKKSFAGAIPLLAPLFVLACTGQITSSPGTNPPGTSTGGSGAPGNSGTGNSGGPGAGGSSGGGLGSGGTIGGTGTGGNSGTGAVTSTGGATGAGTGGVVAPPPPPDVTPAAESAGLMPLTRLTHREYSNTMDQLLGITSAPGAAFETDNAGDAGFLAPNNVATENARQYMTAAETLAAAAVAGGKLGIPCTNPATAAAETTCVTQFVATFGANAYRRPLVKGESDDLVALFQTAKTAGFTFTEAVTKVVEAILQSPNLLYHWELGDQPLVHDTANAALVALTPYQVASRLSYFLGESPPDATLMAAAKAGQLATPEALKTQATRLLQDPARAAKALYNFHSQWLHVDTLQDAAPGDLGVALGQELEAFLASVFVTGDGTLKTLLTAPYTFANATTAKEYGVTATGTTMVKVNLDPTQRQGVLMQIPFLRTNGIAPPVRRGLAVYRQLLCGTIPAPPPVVPEVAPDNPNSTTRERFAAHTQLACANACHGLFDPWGFAFENFDSLGHFRTQENGKTVDASGMPQANGVVGGTTPQKQVIAFNNGTEMVNALADSDEVSWCTSKQWMRYMLGRFEGDAEMGALMNAYAAAAYGPDRLTKKPFSVRDFLVAVVGTKSFRFRAPAPGETL